MSKENLLHIIVDALPATEANWIDVISALLVPVIAIAGVYIAYQQYRINKQRLRHETYERRLAVYKCVQRFLSEIMINAKTTHEKSLQFYSEASEAAFLFDESVQNKIDEIYGKSIKLVAAQEKLYPSDKSPGLPVGEDREKVSQEKYEYFIWLTEQLKESRPFFAKKLGLKVK